MVTSVLLSRLHWTVKCLERSSVTCESGIDTIGLGLLGHLFVAHRCHISRVAQADFRSYLLLSAFCFLLLPLLRRDPAEPASPLIYDQQPYLSLLAPSIRRFSTFFKAQTYLPCDSTIGFLHLPVRHSRGRSSGCET